MNPKIILQKFTISEFDMKKLYDEPYTEDDIPACCAFCDKSVVLNIDEKQTAMCSKKGAVSCDYVCGAFRYDPLKRVPSMPRLNKLDREEY